MQNLSHLAATNRKYLTSAASAIIREEIIQWGNTYLDYGCGKGSDVEKLTKLGFDSQGYDPYYFPEKPKPADVVTMNYVLTVINSQEERLETIARAWALTKKKLLIVDNVSGSGHLIDPGQYSTRGVFTKKFRSQELRAYIEVATGRKAARISKDKFLVSNDSPVVKLWDYQEVIDLSDHLHAEGFIAPYTACIRGDCRGFDYPAGMVDKELKWAGQRREYRLSCRDRSLPGASGKLVRQMWLGKEGCDRFNWGVEAIRRRNKLLKAKFRCRQLSFLEEMAGYRRFDFLDNPDTGIFLDEVQGGMKSVYKDNREALEACKKIF